MVYSPKTWADGVTPITAAELQRMEDAIVRANNTWVPPINRQFMVPPWANASAAGWGGSGREYAWPFLLGATGLVFDQLGFINSAVPSDSSATVRVGLRADASGVPGTLLAESAESASSMTASTTYVTTLGSPVTVTSYMCWLTIRATYSTAGPSVAGGSLSQMPGGQLAAMLASSYGTPPATGHGDRMIFYQTGVTDRGTLGSSFTPANTSTNSWTSNVPMFILRRSA